VKLEVEKNALAGRDNLAHELRAFGCEKLAADLEHADRAAQPLDESKRTVAIMNVECNYEAILDA
jgi:hypothetical protein